jgi:hypothetical protein
MFASIKGWALFLATTALFAAPSVAGQTIGAVCSNPAVQCTSAYSFKPYQLQFQIKQKLVFGQTYKSVPFYAVILESKLATSGEGDDCGYVPEEQRLAVQVLFPAQKVFGSRLNCPEELVLYTNVNQQYNFLAVYGGVTMAQAKQVLEKVKTNGRYKQPYIRRMQVVLEYST